MSVHQEKHEILKKFEVVDIEELGGNYNENIIGYSKKLNSKVYIKIFSNKKRYECECLILNEFAKKYGFLCSGELEHICYCVCEFKDFVPFEIKTDKDIVKIAELIAEFHKKTLHLKDRLSTIETIREKIITNMCNIDKIVVDTKKLESVYKKLYSYLKLCDIEQKNFVPVCLHGDFGLRNIVIENHETIRLIDFERIKQGVYWQDFVKLFQRELILKKEQRIFLDAYFKYLDIECRLPSSLFRMFDNFYNVIGIYNYISNFTDKDFYLLGLRMLDEIQEYFINKTNIIDVLIGLAVGDAWGIATTHYSSFEIKKIYGEKIQTIREKIRKNNPKLKYKKGEVTDDTMQALCLLECYNRLGYIDRPQQVLSLVLLDDKYIKPTTVSGKIKISRNLNNVSWFGLTNASITRSIAIGIISFINNSDSLKIISDVVQCITITHNTYEALSGAIFIASFLCFGLKTKNISKAYNEALKILNVYEKEQNIYYMSKNITCAVNIGAEKYINEVICKEGDWGFLVRESVPVIAAILMMDLPLRDSLIYSVNLGGDADSISAVVGAIMAGVKGISGVEEEMEIVFNENDNLLSKILKINDDLLGLGI